MLRVLQNAFTVAFRDRFALGALVTFLVTVADIPILNIGAPFWGSSLVILPRVFSSAEIFPNDEGLLRSCGQSCITA